MLLYDPEEVKAYIQNPKHEKAIFSIYEAEKAEAEKCRALIKSLYGEILRYLYKQCSDKIELNENVTEAQIERMAEKFSFTVCDQRLYLEIVK